MDWLQLVKNVIATRGVQLASRFATMGLVSLFTWAHIVIPSDDTNKLSVLAATVVAGVVCHLIDIWSHNIVKAKLSDAIVAVAVEAKAEGVQQGIKLGARGTVSTNVFPKLLIVGALLFMTGCTQMDKIEAGISAGIASAATHTSVSVSYDPVTGAAVATLTVKDKNGNIIETRVLNQAEARYACEHCNDKAQRALKETYKQAVKEMEATEKREVLALKVQRKQCASPVVYYTQPAPVTLPDATSTSPQVGDVLSDEPPPSGIMRSTVPRVCDPKTGVCK